MTTSLNLSLAFDLMAITDRQHDFFYHKYTYKCCMNHFSILTVTNIVTF